MNVKKYFVFLFLILTYSVHLISYCQVIQIKGRILTDIRPVSYCQIDFIDPNDTTKKFSAVSDSNGYYKIGITTNVPIERIEGQKAFQLMQNYPNPFEENTVISYRLPFADRVNVKIYNILGQEVKSIHIGDQPSGVHYFMWNGKDNSGNRVSYGVYLYRIETKRWKETKKMLYLNSRGILGFSTSYGLPSNNEITFKKNSSLRKGYYKVKFSRTYQTFPLIRRQEKTDIYIQNDTTLDFIIEEVKGKIVFSKYDSIHNKSFIYKMNVDGTGLTQLSFGNETFNENGNSYLRGFGIEPRWSPDGKKIIYNEITGAPSSHLVLMNEDGSNKKDLTLRDWLCKYPKWSPEGDRVCYIRTGEVGVDGVSIIDTMKNTFDLHIDSGSIVFEGDTIFYDKTSYDWYKDGKHLYIWGSTARIWPQPVEPTWRLFLLELSTGKILKRLTNYNSYKYLFQISPDGERYIFVNNLFIYLKPLSEQKEKMIACCLEYDNFPVPRWSNDGNYIIVVFNENPNSYYPSEIYGNRIYIIDPNEPFKEFRVSPIIGNDPDLFIYNNKEKR